MGFEYNVVQIFIEGRKFGDDSSCNTLALCTALPGQTEIRFKITSSASAKIQFSLYYHPGDIVTLESVAGPMNRFQQAIDAQNQEAVEWGGMVEIVFPESTQARIEGDPLYGFEDEKFDADDYDAVVCDFDRSSGWGWKVEN